MVLQREALASIDVEKLARIVLIESPQVLVAPRLVYDFSNLAQGVPVAGSCSKSK